MTMQKIESRARALSDLKDTLKGLMADLNAGIDQLKRNDLPNIRRAVKRAADIQAELATLVDENRELFDKPKTRVLHGIKVGLEKGKGAIDFEDADAVVAAIKKRLPDMVDVLIITEEKPSKTALAQLTAAQLKSLGCTVTDTADRVIVRPVDGDVDKVVNALLKGAQAEAEASASSA